MKTIFRTLALSAALLSMFTACQREELEQNQEPETPKTHTVTFVAGSPETKTTVDVSDGKTAKFAWTDDDVYRFNLYENSTRADLTLGTLTDGIMTIEAVFTGGVSAGENKYIAVFNSANDLQILYEEAYAEDADILVSKAVSSFKENERVLLQFKREVAIAKMTLKGLDPGEVVNHITVSSTADIAGSYGVEGWYSTKKYLDIYSAKAQDAKETYSIVANESGEAVVWFTCIPQDKSILTVMVEADDGDTYTKEFAKPITLTQGDVKGFGVKMEKVSDPHKNDNGWFLVKNANFLAAGDVIRIGCASQSVVAGAISSDYLTKVDATFDEKGETMVSAESPLEFTIGGTAGAWTLTNDGKSLGSTAAMTLAFGSTNSSFVDTWTISITDTGEALISSTKSTYGTIYYNSRSPRFLNYENSFDGSVVTNIYKKYGTPSESKKNQTISFNPTSYEATIGAKNSYPVLTAQSSGGKTWFSSNTDVATINESTGEITLVAAGETIISVTVAGDDTYKDGTGSYKLTVVNAPETWSLVTDAADLAVGDVIVIVASTAEYALSTTQNTNNRGRVAITKKADNTLTINDNVQQLTLGEGTNTGTFSLSTGSGYLYAASSKDNHLKEQTPLDANGSWTITIDKGKATIKAQGTYTHNWLRYNSQNKIFSCYSSGQGDVQIYKKTVTDSGPYLNVKANKVSDIAAAGENITITVDTNVDSWSAISDNPDFVVKEPSGNTVDVSIAENTGEERKANISITAGELSKTITLTQKGKGATTPASITINSNTENFPSSYGNANTFTEYTLNGLKYMIQQIYVNGSKLQWRASGNNSGTGTMYNSEEMPAGIASIVITYNSSDGNKNHTVKTGASANPTSATSITPTKNGDVYTYSCDGTSKYFVITNGTGAGYIDSIVINFK